MNSINRPIILIGAGGHASVLMEIMLLRQYQVLGVVDFTPKFLKNAPRLPYLGQDDTIYQHVPDSVYLVNGVGSINVIQNRARHDIYLKFTHKGYFFINLIHPFSFIASNVKLGHGVQIMAGSIVQSNVVVEDNVIINTGAQIDHDCQIGISSHLAPRSTLCANVSLENFVHIGTGATLIQNLKIPLGHRVKAGTTIIHSPSQEVLK